MTAHRLRFASPLRGIRLCDPASGLRQPAGESARTCDPLGDIDRAEGRVRDAVATLLCRVTQAIDGLDAAQSARLDEATAWITELALGLAGAVLGVELDAGRYDLIGAVQECLERAVVGARDEPIVIRVHPDDMPAVLGSSDRLSAARELRFEEDSAIPKGSCRVETPAGSVLHEPARALEHLVEHVRERSA